MSTNWEYYYHSDTLGYRVRGEQCEIWYGNDDRWAPSASSADVIRRDCRRVPTEHEAINIAARVPVSVGECKTVIEQSGIYRRAVLLMLKQAGDQAFAFDGGVFNELAVLEGWQGNVSSVHDAIVRATHEQPARAEKGIKCATK